jgi:hypothetical protein
MRPAGVNPAGRIVVGSRVPDQWKNFAALMSVL